MRRLTKTLHQSAPPAAPLSHFRPHCGQSCTIAGKPRGTHGVSVAALDPLNGSVWSCPDTVGCRMWCCISHVPAGAAIFLQPPLRRNQLSSTCFTFQPRAEGSEPQGPLCGASRPTAQLAYSGVCVLYCLCFHCSSYLLFLVILSLLLLQVIQCFQSRHCNVTQCLHTGDSDW